MAASFDQDRLDRLPPFGRFDCPVCMGAALVSTKVRLSCTHELCRSCALRVNRKCPVCRASFELDPGVARKQAQVQAALTDAVSMNSPLLVARVLSVVGSYAEGEEAMRIAMRRPSGALEIVKLLWAHGFPDLAPSKVLAMTDDLVAQDPDVVAFLMFDVDLSKSDRKKLLADVDDPALLASLIRRFRSLDKKDAKYLEFDSDFIVSAVWIALLGEDFELAQELAGYVDEDRNSVQELASRRTYFDKATYTNNVTVLRFLAHKVRFVYGHYLDGLGYNRTSGILNALKKAIHLGHTETATLVFDMLPAKKVKDIGVKIVARAPDRIVAAIARLHTEPDQLKSMIWAAFDVSKRSAARILFSRLLELEGDKASMLVLPKRSDKKKCGGCGGYHCGGSSSDHVKRRSLKEREMCDAFCRP